MHIHSSILYVYIHIIEITITQRIYRPRCTLLWLIIVTKLLIFLSLLVLMLMQRTRLSIHIVHFCLVISYFSLNPILLNL